MKKVILNVRGGNCSGKSTVVRAIMNEAKQYTIDEVLLGGEKTEFTVCDNGETVILGRYDRSACGGCDRYSGGAQVKRALVYAANKYSPKTIVYEGLIYSTTYKMATEIAKLAQSLGYSWRSIFLYREYYEMLDFLEKRNGGSPHGVKQIYGKYITTANVYRKLKENGYYVIKVDVTGLNLEQMLRKVADARREICQ